MVVIQVNNTNYIKLKKKCRNNALYQILIKCELYNNTYQWCPSKQKKKPNIKYIS